MHHLQNTSKPTNYRIEIQFIKIKNFYAVFNAIMNNQEQESHSNNSKKSMKMDIAEGDHEQPIKQYVQVIKEGNRVKRVSTFRCKYCPKSYIRQRRRAVEHMLKECQKRKLLIASNNRYDQTKQYVESVRNNSRTMVQPQNQIAGNNVNKKEKKRIKILQKQVNEMKVQIHTILNTPGKNNKQRIDLGKKLAKDIFQDISSIIKPQFQYKIFRQIQKSLINLQLPPERIKDVMTANLLSSFLSIKVIGTLTTWEQKLSDSIEQILSLLESKSPQARSKTKKAGEFIKVFSEFQLTSENQKFIEQLKCATQYRRSSVVNLYNRLMRKFPSLNLRSLPINLSIYSFVFQRRILDLQDVKRLVLKLWREDKETACDLMLMLVFGVRRSELFRLVLSDNHGDFYSYFKVYEKKNQNTTTRFSSTTLINMIKEAKVGYPITQQRFMKLRSTCLKQLKQFYGIRHVCLTQLTLRLLGDSGLSLHRNPSTTLQRYVSQQTLQQINQVFQIKEFSANKEPISYSQFYLFVDEKQNKEIMKENQILMEYERQQTEATIEDRVHDATLTQGIQRQLYQSHEIDKEQKMEIVSTQYIFNLHQQELLPESYQTQTQLINGIVNKTKLTLDQISQQKLNTQNIVSFRSQMQNLSRILNTNIKTYEFNVDGNEVKKSHIQQNFIAPSTQATIVISKTNRFQISEQIQTLNSRPQRQVRILRKRNTLVKGTYIYQNSLSCCTRCHDNYLEPTRKKGKNILFCRKCSFKTSEWPIMSRQLKESKHVVIKLEVCRRSTLVHTSIKKRISRNNIAQKVQELFGKNIYTNETFYGLDVPSVIFTQALCHSKTTTQQLFILSTREIIYNKQNQQYLPLTIKQSSIMNAGLGLYSQIDIMKDQIICTYCGVIRTHGSVNYQNDSIFLLGSLLSHYQQEPYQLYIEASDKFNVGRFINSKDFSQSNSYPMMGILNTLQKNQICLYLVSSRFIKKGQEIFYDYGDMYLKFKDQDES